jgi:hypothetical protein
MTNDALFARGCLIAFAFSIAVAAVVALGIWAVMR